MCTTDIIIYISKTVIQSGIFGHNLIFFGVVSNLSCGNVGSALGYLLVYVEK